MNERLETGELTSTEPIGWCACATERITPFFPSHIKDSFKINDSFKTGASSHNPNVEEVAIFYKLRSCTMASRSSSKQGKGNFFVFVLRLFLVLIIILTLISVIYLVFYHRISVRFYFRFARHALFTSENGLSYIKAVYLHQFI